MWSRARSHATLLADIAAIGEAIAVHATRLEMHAAEKYSQLLRMESFRRKATQMLPSLEGDCWLVRETNYHTGTENFSLVSSHSTFYRGTL